MKRLLLLLVLVVHPASAHGQASYSLRSSAIGSAGGPSSGGGYDMHGAGGLIGGLQEGGAYTLFGGFPLPALQDPVAVEQVDPVPRAFLLRAPEPTPFRDRVAIAFELPDQRHVSVFVYSVDGRRLLERADEDFGAGRHRVLWDGNDGAGRPIRPGMYFVQVIAGSTTATRRLVRLQ